MNSQSPIKDRLQRRVPALHGVGAEVRAAEASLDAMRRAEIRLCRLAHCYAQQRDTEKLLRACRRLATLRRRLYN